MIEGELRECAAYSVPSVLVTQHELGEQNECETLPPWPIGVVPAEMHARSPTDSCARRSGAVT